MMLSIYLLIFQINEISGVQTFQSGYYTPCKYYEHILSVNLYINL